MRPILVALAFIAVLILSWAVVCGIGILIGEAVS